MIISILISSVVSSVTLFRVIVDHCAIVLSGLDGADESATKDMILTAGEIAGHYRSIIPVEGMSSMWQESERSFQFLYSGDMKENNSNQVIFLSTMDLRKLVKQSTATIVQNIREGYVGYFRLVKPIVLATTLLGFLRVESAKGPQDYFRPSIEWNTLLVYPQSNLIRAINAIDEKARIGVVICPGTSVSILRAALDELIPKSFHVKYYKQDDMSAMIQNNSTRHMKLIFWCEGASSNDKDAERRLQFIRAQNYHGTKQSVVFALRAADALKQKSSIKDAGFDAIIPNTISVSQVHQLVYYGFYLYENRAFCFVKVAK